VQLDANLTVQGVIALPVMQIPQPTLHDRVLDGSHGAEVAVPVASSNPGALHSARAGLLARLTNPQPRLP
jgi:hypothetical protein